MKKNEARVTEGKQMEEQESETSSWRTSWWTGGRRQREERKSLILPGLGAWMASVNGVWLSLWTPGCSHLPEGSTRRGQRLQDSFLPPHGLAVWSWRSRWALLAVILQDLFSKSSGRLKRRIQFLVLAAEVIFTNLVPWSQFFNLTFICKMSIILVELPTCKGSCDSPLEKLVGKQFETIEKIQIHKALMLFIWPIQSINGNTVANIFMQLLSSSATTYWMLTTW